MMKFLTEFRSRESGATAIEYGLIASLVILVAMGAFFQLGRATSSMWNSVSTHITGP